MSETIIVYSEKRIKKVSSGINFLEMWLENLGRDGLRTLCSQDHQYFKNIINTLVSYKLDKIADKIFRIQLLIKDDSDWLPRVANIIGEIYLLIQDYKNVDKFTENKQIELRTKTGWGQNHDYLVNQPFITDKWYVIAQKKVKRFDNKSFIFTYLIGEHTGQQALIRRNFDKSKNVDQFLIPGNKFLAQMQFYPRLFKLNADFKNRSEIEFFDNIPFAGFSSLQEVFSVLNKILYDNPWITFYPFLIDSVSLVFEDKLFIEDKNGYRIPVNKSFKHFEALTAMGLTKGIKIFGEWYLGEFYPLTVFAGNYFLSFYNSESLLI